MRIEKINEKQIRCTLNQKDLKDREIGISELAYGTAKAKALFRDMMQQASYELGFDADDIPLMIEAIPLLPEALVLVITKVEDPDELDTRFSSFTEDHDWEEDMDTAYDEFQEYNDALMNYDDSDEPDIWNYSDDVSSDADKAEADETDFISLPEVLGMEPKPKAVAEKKTRDIVMIFSFRTLDDVIQLSKHLDTIYHGQNTLYKDNADTAYYLVLHRSNHSPEEFTKICNILYEYGSLIKNPITMQYYYEEHFEPIISNNALSVLANL